MRSPRLALGLVFVVLLQQVGKLPSIRWPPRGREALSDAFARLPDSGAVCWITLLVEKAWDPLSGHAFLSLVKSNSRDSVVRYLGFYRQNPNQGLFSDVPVPAKVVNDAYHPYHASLRRRVSTAELQAALRTLEGLSASRYQTYHFNSVDFALRLLAEARMSQPILPSARPWTPGRLYRMLKDRQKTVPDSAESIVIARGVEYAGPDHTPPIPSKHFPHL